MGDVLVGGGSRLWRVRWAAIGAAVAVSLGGGGLLIADAAGGTESSTVLTDPVRVLDSRDPVNVGLSGPFVSAVSQKLQITGSVPTTTGIKTVVPVGATGVVLNVTPVGATADGFVSIRPGDATGAPATSSLNFTVGAVLPNAVLVALPTSGGNAGQIDITFDAYGTPGPATDMLIDVVGYTSDAKLNALQTQVDAMQAVNASQQSQINGNATAIAAVPKIVAVQQSDTPLPLPPSEKNFPFSGTWSVTTTSSGPVLLNLEVSLRYVCTAAGDVRTWLLIDGVAAPASSGLFVATGQSVQIAFTEIVNLTAGTHQLGMGTKCSAGTWSVISQNNLNGWAMSLGAGTVIPTSDQPSMVLHDGGENASGGCTVTRDEAAPTCANPE